MTIRSHLHHARVILGRWLLKPELAAIQSAADACAASVTHLWEERATLRDKVSGLEDALFRVNVAARRAGGHVDASIVGQTEYRGGTIAEQALTYDRVRFPQANIVIRVEPTGDLSVLRPGRQHDRFEITKTGLRFPDVATRPDGSTYGGSVLTLP